MPITERDKLGRIVKSTLSSEEASRMGKVGGSEKAPSTSRDQLLREAGYENPDEAPESKRLLAQQAAKGYVPAIKGFLSKEEAKDVSVVVVQPGERCPTCQQYVLADMQITDEDMDKVINELEL